MAIADGTVSDVILAILKKHGVRYFCGLPAAQIGLVMHGASSDPDFTYVTTRHEEAAGHMAHAISRTSGSLGVCFATVGPGAANLVPGVAAAFADNIPMIVITGQNQAAQVDPSRDQLQSLDQLGLYRSITKWSASVHHAERAAELTERAVHMALSGRPGPVHLDIPCDVGTFPCRYDLDTVPAYTAFRNLPSPAELDRLVAALRNARRPLLLAGGGVVRSGGVAEFRRLVERTGFPATTTIMGRGTIAPEDDRYIGSGGVIAGKGALEALQTADVILAVGCKFSTWTIVDKRPRFAKPAGQKIVQLDIDPEAIGKAVAVDIGLVGDAAETLRALADRMDEGGPFALDLGWRDKLRRTYLAYRGEVDQIANTKVVGAPELPNEATLARALTATLPPDALVVLDGGQTMMWMSTFYRPADPAAVLTEPGMGHLGFGLPFANAAKLAHPNRPVVCVAGDGAFGLTVQELETAARYRLNTISIVFNDSYWGMYRPLAEMLQNKNFGTKLTDVNFAKVAEGFGCYGEQVAGVDALPAAYARAVRSGKPAVLDVRTVYTPHPMDFVWNEVILQGMHFRPPAAAQDVAA
jgi:acetolactate synthase-1/2/3 large subunit